MNMAEVVSWIGCITGLLGSALLAFKLKSSGWGFVAYLASNVVWGFYAITTGNIPMLLQQLGFTLTSGIGIYNWLLTSPAPAKKHDAIDRIAHGNVVELRRKVA